MKNTIQCGTLCKDTKQIKAMYIIFQLLIVDGPVKTSNNVNPI